MLKVEMSDEKIMEEVVLREMMYEEDVQLLDEILEEDFSSYIYH